MEDISICIPIYFKESVSVIERCFESLTCQTVQPKEIVCALDDPATPEIEACLEELSKKTDSNVKLCYTKRGSGLGAVLKTGIEHCTGKYIARMDVDDIAVPERLEKEKLFLDTHLEVDVVGSNIAEFEDDIEHIIGFRNVPENDLDCKKMLKWRDPINHMTAMYRRNSVLKAGNYSAQMYSCEDTHLWTSFYKHGLKFANIQENLVLVHGGGELYQRRGGKKAFSFVKRAISYKKEVGLISSFGACIQKTANYIVLVMMPNALRGFIYEKVLRKHKKTK